MSTVHVRAASLPPAAFDDTPSRHPCKIRIASEQKRFMFNPYRAQVVLSDGSSDDDVTDLFVDASDEEPLQPTEIQPAQDEIESPKPSAGAPMPVASSPTTKTSSSSAHYAKDASCFRLAPGNMRYAFVRFKVSEGVFFIPESERSGLGVGDLVVVDGDRGENVGTIVADVSHSQPLGQPNPTIPPIVRRALNKDRKKFYQARRKESFANSVSSELVRDLALQMQVLDSEFQTDLMKVTLYYRPLCDGPVDFRQLQRALFKQFRCRIWLVNWDPEFQNARQKLQASVLPSMMEAASSNMMPAFSIGTPFLCH